MSKCRGRGAHNAWVREAWRADVSRGMWGFWTCHWSPTCDGQSGAPVSKRLSFTQEARDPPPPVPRGGRREPAGSLGRGSALFKSSGQSYVSTGLARWLRSCHSFSPVLHENVTGLSYICVTVLAAAPRGRMIRIAYGSYECFLLGIKFCSRKTFLLC